MKLMICAALLLACVAEASARDCYLEIFKDWKYKGERTVWRESGNLGRLNNHMSSFKLPPGCCVEVFHGNDHTGKSMQLCKNSDWIGHEWNDKVSSVKIEEDPKYVDPNAPKGCVGKTGKTPGKACIFPFTYAKKSCPGPKCCNLDNDAKGAWCSTKVDAAGRHVEGNYNYCAGTDCAPGEASRDAICPDNNRMYPGDNIGNPAAKSWQECAQECYKNKKCAAFTFTVKTNRCSLKTKIVVSKEKSGKISGTRACAVKNKPVAAPSYLYKDNKGTTCTKYESKGCFSEKASFKRNDSKLLVYWRHDITWKKLQSFGRSLVCTCAKAARAANKKYFAIHYWGECWSINMGNFRKNNKGDCVRALGGSCVGEKGKRICLAAKDFQVYEA